MLGLLRMRNESETIWPCLAISRPSASSSPASERARAFPSKPWAMRRVQPAPTIMRLERGEFGRPDPEKLQRIARALDLDARDLFALAGYVPSDGLPNFGPYLEAKYGDELSASARKELERHFERLRKKRGQGGRRG